MLPLLPLLIALAGSALLLLGLNPGFRQTGLIAVLTAAAILATLLVTAFFLPAAAVLSAWAPNTLFSAGLQLHTDVLAWLFGLPIAMLALATLLTGLARGGGRRLAIRGAMLLLTGAGLAAVFAGNLPTRIMAWAGLDLIYFLTLLALARAEGVELQAVLNLAFNSVGTLLALAAAVLAARTSTALSLQEAALSPQAIILFALALVFRLGLFPLHLGLPAEANIRQGLGTMLRLVPAAVALELVARLTAFGFVEPLRLWLTIFAAAAALIGAGQLWSVADPKQSLTYVVIAQSGLVLLAGLWAGPQASPVVTAQSLALVLGGGLLYLASSARPDRRLTLAPTLLGAATLAGAPLTVGFTGFAGLYGGLIQSGQWVVLAVVFLAQSILAAGLWRAAFAPADDTAETDPLAAVLYGLGLSLLGAGVVLFGVFGGALFVALGAPLLPVSGLGAVLGLAALAVSVGAARYRNALQAPSILIGRLFQAVARLDWLYRSVWAAIRWLGSLITVVTNVLEGEGALLWTGVAVLLAYLALR